MLFDVDVRSTSLPALAPPRMAVALPSEEMLSSEPAANEAYVWSCNICGFGDAGSPEGVCILCEALSKNQ